MSEQSADNQDIAVCKNDEIDPPCERPVYVKGYCIRCYLRLRRGVPLNRPERQPVVGTCKNDEINPPCVRPAYAKGYCYRCYKRVKNGIPLDKKEKRHPSVPFEDSLRRDEKTGCLEWMAGRFASGYGKYRGKGVHVIVWESHNDPVPRGLFVCHTCDNPPCAEISHLFIDTHAGNMADAKKKGRMHRGSKHGMSKLTEDQVLSIRRDKRKHKVIAEEYGVSAGAVSHIKRRTTWAWLQDEE